MTRTLRLMRAFGLGRSLGLIVLVAMIALRVWDPPPVEAVRLRTFDFYQLLKPRQITARPVVIVDIDDESLKELGQWPWPRTMVADLVSRLTAMGAAVIGFDIVFAEPDRLSPAVAAQSFRGLDDGTREKLASLPDNDRVLADAIARSRVIVGQTGYNVPADPGAVKPEQTNFGVRYLSKPPVDAEPFLVTFPSLVGNIPALQSAAAGKGLFSIDPEQDGIVRRVPLVMRAGDINTPSLTMEMWRVVAGGNAFVVQTNEAGITNVVVGGLAVPTDNRGRLWVHFSPHDRSRFVSAKDVLAGNAPADRFAQRFVLIGTSALGLLDNKTTPVGPNMPGVEIHAQLLETVFGKTALTTPNDIIGWEILGTLLVGLMIIILGPLLGATTLGVAGAVFAAATVGLSWYFFDQKRILVDATFPLLATFSVYAVLVFTNYMREQADRQQIRSAFGQYLSPVLVEQLARYPEKLRLGGEDRRITVLFSDIRGFTSISERFKTDPQGLVTLMNRFLTPLTNAIIDHKGYIDKYMGDAIMAFWNAPLDDPAHETNACLAALDMLDRLAALNEERQREAEATGQATFPLRAGIGMNSGLALVGNMGSTQHVNYSALGDTVNLASRLEGQTVNYGVSIVVGATTAEAAKTSVATIEIDYVAVKGKSEPEHVYAVVGRADMLADPGFQAFKSAHIEMTEHYRHARFADAKAVLNAAQQRYDAFGFARLVELYRERIADYELNPPPPDWDGSLKLETK